MRYAAETSTSLFVLIITSGTALSDAFLSVVPKLKWCAFGQLRFTRRCQLLPFHEARPIPAHRQHQVEDNYGRYRNPSTLTTKIFAVTGGGWLHYPVMQGLGRRRLRVIAPPRMSSDSSSGGDLVNPLRRDDAERVGINSLISVLASTPMDQWRPDALEAHLPSLLKGGLFRQTMIERLAKARSRKDREALTKVDAFLTGYLGQEKRKGSRAKVSRILSAATVGPAELDQCIKVLGSDKGLDDDLRDYLATLVTAEENKFKDSLLLQVLKTVRDRVEAEIKIGSRPEIGTLAQALNVKDPKERRKYLEGAFTKLEDLDEFVSFLGEAIEYMGGQVSFAVKTNMPHENLGKIKAIHAEVSAIRRRYLQ